MSGLIIGCINDFSLGIYDGPHATPRESEEGPIFLGIKNVTLGGRLDFSEIRHVSEEEFPRWTRRVLPQEDDIVFSYEATLHRYAIIPEGFRGCLGRRMALVRPDKNKINARFLHYYFMSQEWRDTIEANIISGATVDRIPIKKFPDFELRLPPLNIQVLIADILSSYDDLIENNQRRIKLLEESAQLLYREWFVHLRFPGYEHTHIVDGVPEVWEKGSAYDAMQILSGGTPKTTVHDYWDGEMPFYTPRDSTDQCYILDTEKHLTELGLNNCNSQLYPKDTVFITARGTVGNLNLAQKPMAMNQSCYALMGKSNVSQLYLFSAVKEAIQHFHQQAVGAVFDAIIIDTFKLIPFVVPEAKMVKMFDGIVRLIFQQIETLLLQNQKLKSARDLLLPKLMNGGINV